jgi:signal transduction histidine kinase
MAVAPDTTGTTTWRWRPVRTGQAVVQVQVTDTDDSVVTKQFTIVVEDTQITAAGITPLESSPTATTIPGRIIQTITDGVRHVIQALPRPVVYSFPYILLVLLGVHLLVLLFQVKRELSAYRTLSALLAQLQAVSEGKRTFMELVSHYFRTPLTVLAGGIDMLQPADAPQASVDALQTVSKRLHTTTEQLIGQAAVTSLQQVAPAGTAAGSDIWRYIGLCTPVVLIGVIAYLCTYVTKTAGNFTISQLNIAIQSITYILLVSAIFQVFRRVQLRKHETALARQVVEQEETAAKARDELMTASAASLAGDVRQLDSLLTTLPDTKSIQFIRNGQMRFHQLAAKFTLVAGLRGGHSGRSPESVTLREILQLASERLRPQLARRQVTVTAPQAVETITVRDKALTAYVVGSVLDNAVAFSPEHANVEVAMHHEAGGTLLTVTDYGPGIPEERQTALFQPFSKAAGVQTFDHEGIGLGLYTDKLIMDYIGGGISLASTPGRTVITLRMPV